MHNTIAYSTLRMLLFHGFQIEDLGQHLLLSEVVWTMNQVKDENTNTSQLETTFRYHTLIWYMKYKSIVLFRQQRTLIEKKHEFLKEF